VPSSSSVPCCVPAMLAAGISGNDQHACRRVSGSAASAAPRAGRCSPAAGAVRSATVPRRPGKGGAQRLPPPPAGSAGCPRACRPAGGEGQRRGNTSVRAAAATRAKPARRTTSCHDRMSGGQLTDTLASVQLARDRVLPAAPAADRRRSSPDRPDQAVLMASLIEGTTGCTPLRKGARSDLAGDL